MVSDLNKIQPHDIVRVTEKAKLSIIAPLASEAQYYWERTPYHVIRRARSPIDNLFEEQLAVGIRGDFRYQRFGIYIPRSWVMEVITPQDVIKSRIWTQWPRKKEFLKITRSLDMLSDLLADYPIGIGGSIGYELVTNLRMVREKSDIDIILYSEKTAKKYLTPDQAKGILSVLNTIPTSIDIQVQNKKGAFHLQEYVNAKGGQILLKTDTGPIMSKDIW